MEKKLQKEYVALSLTVLADVPDVVRTSDMGEWDDFAVGVSEISNAIEEAFKL